MTPEQKVTIDGMSRVEMARKWRFGPIGDPLLQGEAGDYYVERFKGLGFFSPEISKQIDRERGL